VCVCVCVCVCARARACVCVCVCKRPTNACKETSALIEPSLSLNREAEESLKRG
jgi:hypothetical protein